MKYWVLLEDQIVLAEERNTNLKSSVLLKRGCIFKGLEGSMGKDNENCILSSYTDTLSDFVIHKNILTLIDEYYVDESGRSTSVLNNRSDYKLRVGNSSHVIIHNSFALDYILGMNKKVDVNKDHIKLFKYLPVKSLGIKGFYANNYIISVKSDGKIVYKKSEIKNPESYFCLNTIEEQCKFKVKGYIDSSKLFKFTELKKSLVGLIFKGEELSLNAIIKQDENGKYNTIKLVLEDGRKTRFLLSDLEIIYPNISGFNPPKDRVIHNGAIVKVADNRRLCIPKDVKVKVLDIKTVGNKKYAIVDYNNSKIYTKIKQLRVC